MSASVEVGARVVTADGIELGTVKEVAEGDFKVDVRHHADYWLDHEIVVEATNEVVSLSVNDEELGAWKKDSPHDTGIFEGSLDPSLDPSTVGDYALLQGLDQGPPAPRLGP
ncbi:MAG: hypothetical protein WD557_13290 [Dehalococcoidia bacterium]